MTAKTILITGASRGIGKAIAHQLASEGHHLLLTAKNSATLEATAASLKMEFPNCSITSYLADMAQPNEVQALIDQLLANQQCLDVVVHNAGIFMPGKLMEEEMLHLQNMFQVNLLSIFQLTQGILPLMKKSKTPHIFTMGSIAGMAAYDNGGSYSISKFALMGFTKNLRKELAPQNIKVTTLLPGATYTDSWASANLPASQFIQPKDVALLISTCMQLSPAAVVEEILLQPMTGPF